MTWDVAIVPPVRDWLQELRRDDPAALAAVSAALDLLVRDGPALGPPLADALAPMTSCAACPPRHPQPRRSLPLAPTPQPPRPEPVVNTLVSGGPKQTKTGTGARLRSRFY